MTSNALHGVNLEAFVVQSHVGCVALKTALRALDGRFLEHTHACTAGNAPGGFLACLSARNAASKRFNTRCACNQADDAVDGDVACVLAVIGLCTSSNLIGLFLGVLASLDQLVADGLIDAALRGAHALRGTSGTLQNESRSASLAKTRDH